MRVLAIVGFVSLWSGIACGQISETTAGTPAFQVADVHASSPSVSPWVGGGVMGGGYYVLQHATMVDLITIAWGIDAEKVVGGPSWLESDRFDVRAKAAPDTSPNVMLLMLRSLLADRFRLVVHTAEEPRPAFVLTVGKNPKLKPGDGSGDTGCHATQQSSRSTAGAIQDAVVVCRNVTMADFAAGIGGMAGEAYITHPVIDKTGLAGTWNFTISWTAQRFLEPAGSQGITFFDAVDRQLGLELESQNVPTPVLVVDSVERKPTDNLPGVTQMLPAVPTEFEVSDIKLSDPNEKFSGEIQPGGRLVFHAWTIRQLIHNAWSITSDDMIAGGPKWIDTVRFDVVGKTSGATQTTGVNVPSVDWDTIQLMLRALLADRLKLVVHTEDRPATVYSMVAAKPRLTKADPSSRTECKRAGEATGTGASLVAAISYTCRNTTMAQLANDLQRVYGSGLAHPVVDSTGLQGAWDFSIAWSVQAPSQSGDAGSAAPGMGAAQDPTGGLSLPEVLYKQLGLKLEIEKRVMPVLVIDHVEQKPTDN
jgi:uncharacterized protein (TIGR03435 family)